MSKAKKATVQKSAERKSHVQKKKVVKQRPVHEDLMEGISPGAGKNKK